MDRNEIGQVSSAKTMVQNASDSKDRPVTLCELYGV